MDLFQAPLKEMEAPLIEKHHVLPLFRRGRKIFVGVSYPANLQALDEIKFKTGLIVEAVVVEEEQKLVRAIEKAVHAMNTNMEGLDEDSGALDIAAGEEDAQTLDE